MQELYVNECTCQDETETIYIFQYFLLTNTTILDGIPYMDYGVMAQIPGSEPVRIPHLTTDRTRIDELLSLLQTYMVSPSHLRDVIDDWL